MEAGFGKEDITPPLGAELCGYGYDLNRRGERIHDKLNASCTAFKSGNENDKYLIINCDIIGFDDEILLKTKDLIKSKYGISEDCVMLIATHTHTGPATKALTGCGEPDEKYLNDLPGKIFTAAEKALSDLTPVEYMQTSQKEIEPIGYNRAISNGPEDHFVRGFLIKRSGASDIAVASYNCHPVSMGGSTLISRDYPGQSADALTKTGMNGVFITGVCGDIDPAGVRGDFKVITEYGERIAKGFSNGLSNDKQCPENFSHDVVKIPVPLQIFDADKIRQTAEDIINHSSDAGFNRVVKEWENFILNALESKNLEYLTHEEGTAHIFSVGDLLIVGINYEAFTEIGSEIRGAFPDKTVIVAGNTDSVRGYFPTKPAIDKGDDYAAFSSSFLYKKLPVTGEAAEVFVRAVISGIKKLY